MVAEAARVVLGRLRAAVNSKELDAAGLEAVVAASWAGDSAEIGRSILSGVEHYAGDMRLADDLTVLVLKRAAGTPSPV